MKNFALAAGVLAISAVLIGASVWEGAAAEDGAGGELPKTGYYAATNSFPRNTMVEVMNLETGQKIRVVVIAGLNAPGLLTTLSHDAALAIGLRGSGQGDRPVGRVQMSPDSPEGISITTVVYYPENHIERGEYPEFFSPPIILVEEENGVSEPEISWAAISAEDVQPLSPEDIAQPVFVPPPITVTAPIVVREIPYEMRTGGQERPPLADPAFSVNQFQLVPAEDRPPLADPAFSVNQFQLVPAEERPPLTDPAYSLIQFQFVPAEDRPPVYYTPGIDLPALEAPPIRSPVNTPAIAPPALEASPIHSPVNTPAIVPPAAEAPQIRSQIQAGGGGEQRIIIELIPQARGQAAVPAPAPQAVVPTPAPPAPPPSPARQEIYLDPSLFIGPISPPVSWPAPAPAVPVPAAPVPAVPVPAVPVPVAPAPVAPVPVAPAPAAPAPVAPAPVAPAPVPVAPSPVPYYVSVPVPIPEPQPSPPSPSPVRFSAPVIGGLEPGKYYIQLGVYSRPAAVEDELTRIGRTYPLVIQGTGSASSPLYRILLGPVNKGESGALLQQFKGRGYTDAFVRSGS